MKKQARNRLAPTKSPDCKQKIRSVEYHHKVDHPATFSTGIVPFYCLRYGYVVYWKQGKRRGHENSVYQSTLFITPERLTEAAFAVLEDNQIQENLRLLQIEIVRFPGNKGAVRIIEANH